MKKKILFIMILFIFMFIPYNKVEAKTLQDLYNELDVLEKKREAANNNQKLTESEINKLNSEIATINSNITITKNEIVQAEKDVKKSEEEISNKKEETNDYLLFLQLSNSGNTYLEYLFDAEDYTDFIYRYAVVSQMSEYNNNLINDLEKLIEELGEKKKDLSEKEKKLETQRNEFNSKLITLRANLKDIKAEGYDIDDDIEVLKRQINNYKNMGCSLNQDLSVCTKVPYADGWKYPLKSGCVTSEYTGFNERTDYSGGGDHHAIDLGCNPEGTPVYAAAAGVVRRIARYNCGGNAVYIYHIVNGKGYTSVYMHLLSYNVKENQHVTEDTVIGYVGGYSTSSAHGGYDNCTTGAHLHFGLASGDNFASFNVYSFNPRNLFKFPYGWGYFYR